MKRIFINDVTNGIYTTLCLYVCLSFCLYTCSSFFSLYFFCLSIFFMSSPHVSNWNANVIKSDLKFYTQVSISNLSCTSKSLIWNFKFLSQCLRVYNSLSSCGLEPQSLSLIYVTEIVRYELCRGWTFHAITKRAEAKEAFN